jgi:hypothetical protein
MVQSTLGVLTPTRRLHAQKWTAMASARRASLEVSLACWVGVRPMLPSRGSSNGGPPRAEGSRD